MSFVLMMNEYVVVSACLIVAALILGFSLAFRTGNGKKHLPYLLTLAIYSIYLLISPYYFYVNGFRTIIGTDISNYYGIGFYINFLTIICFVFGYWVKDRKQEKWNEPAPVFNAKKMHKFVGYLFYFFYGIVMINLAIGGVNVQNLFAGNEVVGQGASGASYYLQNFTDSLITVLILGYLTGVPRRKLLVWIGLSFFLFSVLGFRYRIIISLIGFILAYLFMNEIKTRQIVVAIVLGVLSLYLIIFSTINRQALLVREYQSIVYDPLEFEMEGFFIQTRGALADMAVYKLYDDPNQDVKHDQGLTMFGYIFIRMIPRFIYPDKDSFYPPPQLAIQSQAYFAWWASKSGEAILSTGAIFIAWGYYGVLLANFFWGLLLRRFLGFINKQDPLSLIVYIIVGLATFLWITRGYFPQTIDHFFYLMFPVWALRYLRKKYPDASN